MTQDKRIIDTTLREGEQTPGVQFTLAEKMRIVAGLVEVGVAEIEIGVSSPLVTCTAPLISSCRSRYPGLPLSLWSRCRAEDIGHAAALKPDVLALSIPVSDIHLTKKLGRNRSWAAETLRRAIALTRDSGLTAAVGFEDATRADPDFLDAMADLAQESGAVRIRLADTVGIASPGSIGELVARLKKRLPAGEIGIHAHNDFGMATANSISALESGAVWADASVLGLGERTGCARLEELVAYLSLVQGHLTLKPHRLKPLAALVASLTGRKIAGHRPILGDEIFACETGLHLIGLQVDPQTYEPYAPERVGARRKLLFGAKCGRKALQQRLEARSEGEAAGAVIGETQIRAVRETARQLRRPLSEAELLNCLTGAELSAGRG